MPRVVYDVRLAVLRRAHGVDMSLDVYFFFTGSDTVSSSGESRYLTTRVMRDARS